MMASKFTCVTILIALLPLSSMATVTNMTGTAYKAAYTADQPTIIKSTSGNCFGPDSQYYGQLTVKTDTSDDSIVNGYHTFDDCIASGGQISTSEKKRLIVTGNMSISDIQEKAEKEVEVKIKIAETAAIQEKDDADKTSFGGLSFGAGLAFTSLPDTLCVIT